jgi:amino-acid N-acetyltransferase
VTDIDWFREASPYIKAHRGSTAVVYFAGEALEAENFPSLLHDLTLLSHLGLRLVLVHGIRPQIDARLAARGIDAQYHNGLRITDNDALPAVMEAAGAARVQLEALFSLGLPNTPMSGARLRVASGNFVTARPTGVRDGIDFQHTGEVRRIDATSIRELLDLGQLVLLSPLGYSPTGEVFNLRSEEVAAEVAAALHADKLLYLLDGERAGLAALPNELDLAAADTLANTLAAQRADSDTEGDASRALRLSAAACRRSVRRCHLLDWRENGALLSELYTRDGAGSMVSGDRYEGLRRAGIEDVGGLLDLIAPMEAEGSLVRRSREQLELEIENFWVVERDGMIIACAALYPYPGDELAVGCGELACVARHPDYQGGGRGDALLARIEMEARELGLSRLFVLTTRTAHWFRERGFLPAQLDDLPVKKREMYNYQRASKVFIKPL